MNFVHFILDFVEPVPIVDLRYVGSVDRLYRVAVEVWRRGAERRARCGKADRCAEKLGRGRSLTYTR